MIPRNNFFGDQDDTDDDNVPRSRLEEEDRDLLIDEDDLDEDDEDNLDLDDEDD